MATRTTMHIEVVTAERELYNGEADEVNVPGTEGQLGILPRHAALLAFLKPGPMSIKLGGEEETLFVSGGFVEVSNNQITVLADAAEIADEIDEARAEEARRRAQERLVQARSDVERADYQAELARALSRLHVSELARRRPRRRIMSSEPQE